MTNTRHTSRRHWAFGPVLLLVGALLWAQALGLAHRVVHGSQLAGRSAVPVAASTTVDAPMVAPASVLARLFSSHQGDPDCLVFDQLGHADSLPALPLLALPVLAPLPPLVTAAERLLGSLSLSFQARAPPLTR